MLPFTSYPLPDLNLIKHNETIVHLDFLFETESLKNAETYQFKTGI